MYTFVKSILGNYYQSWSRKTAEHTPERWQCFDVFDALMFSVTINTNPLLKNVQKIIKEVKEMKEVHVQCSNNNNIKQTLEKSAHSLIY